MDTGRVDPFSFGVYQARSLFGNGQLSTYQQNGAKATDPNVTFLALIPEEKVEKGTTWALPFVKISLALNVTERFMQHTIIHLGAFLLQPFAAGTIRRISVIRHFTKNAIPPNNKLSFICKLPVRNNAFVFDAYSYRERVNVRVISSVRFRKSMIGLGFGTLPGITGY